VFLVSCSRSPVVTLRNDSGVQLQNIVVSGSGFSEKIDILLVGGTHSFSPRIRGESGIRVQFDAAGQHHDPGEQGYFEAGEPYRVSVMIDPKMNVAVDAKRD
jgi:hypothetical protein